jgi:hypothetical protein
MLRGASGQNMVFIIPQSATEYGFRLKQGGAHGSKTMMLREARLLFAASRPKTGFEELKRLVLEENVLLKDTFSNREDVFKRLSDLYGLRPELPLYHALRILWDTSEQEQPLLALLCALARDPLLRTTASVVLEQPEGAIVSPAMLETALEAAYPEHYSAKTKLSISQNTAASWAQAGVVSAAAVHKVRRRPVSGPASATYALLLGFLCDARGTLLLETTWAKVLDITPDGLDSLAKAAAQRGWIDYRRLGNVADIGFSYLLQDLGEPLGGVHGRY